MIWLIEHFWWLIPVVKKIFRVNLDPMPQLDSNVEAEYANTAARYCHPAVWIQISIKLGIKCPRVELYYLRQ